MVSDANNDADTVCSDLNVKCFEEVTTSEEVIRDSDPYIDLEEILKNKHVDLEAYIKMSSISKDIKKDMAERTKGQGNNVLWQRARHI